MAAEAVMKADALMHPLGFFSTSHTLDIGVQALNCAWEVSASFPLHESGLSLTRNVAILNAVITPVVIHTARACII